MMLSGTHFCSAWIPCSLLFTLPSLSFKLSEPVSIFYTILCETDWTTEYTIKEKHIALALEIGQEGTISQAVHVEHS